MIRGMGERMPEKLAISVISLLIVVSLYKAYSWRRDYKRQRVADNKFRLYAVRDQLIGLVAEGKVTENDSIFTLFYRATNDIVRHQHKFTLYALVKRAMKDDAAKTQSRDFIKALDGKLAERDPALRTAVSNFYRAMLYIVVSNSLTLKFLLRSHGFISPIIRLTKRLSKMLPTLLVFSRGWMDAYSLGRTSELALNSVKSLE